MVKTPNFFYESIRKLYATEHDHAVLVVDSERCLHISYPKAKLVPIHQYLQPRRDPLLIKITERGLPGAERARFISNVKHASVGKQYDSVRIFEFFRMSVPEKLGIQAGLFGSAVVQKVRNMGLGLPSSLLAGDKDRADESIVILEALQRSEKKASSQGKKRNKADDERVICSDVIFKHLSRFIPQLSHAVLHDEKGLLGDLDFHVNGWVSPKDLSRIAAVHTPTYFVSVRVHDAESEPEEPEAKSAELMESADGDKEGITIVEKREQTWAEKI